MFEAKHRFDKNNKLIETWQLKITRAHKPPEVIRDSETKRAWFGIG
jgi:hypothetical protein